ncbi:MAG: hypothetical protein FWF92_10170 [Oscillospiraceae bacterium]|nr:hypothetical protein [Oscillospiraceae bacterium]
MKTKTNMKIKSIFKIFKSPKVIAVFKIIILAAYCALICAAILFSFKSVFNAVTGVNPTFSDNINRSCFVLMSS